LLRDDFSSSPEDGSIRATSTGDVMPTYIYETIPDDPRALPRRFEVRQAIDEPPLAADPETGTPVRRVISGSLTTLTKRNDAGAPEPGAACGPDTCGCGRFD